MLASVKELLARVPAVDGLQFRVHEESGLANEGMEGLWHDVFAARAQAPGRASLVELRGKNTPDAVIDAALRRASTCGSRRNTGWSRWGCRSTRCTSTRRTSTTAGTATRTSCATRSATTWTGGCGTAARRGCCSGATPNTSAATARRPRLYDSPNWDVQEPLATKMEAQRPDLPPFDLMPRAVPLLRLRVRALLALLPGLGPARLQPRTRRPRCGGGSSAAASAPPPRRTSRPACTAPREVLPMIVASVYPYWGFPTTRGWAERQALGTSLARYAANEGTDVGLFESFDAAAKRILAAAPRGGGDATTTAKVTPEATSRWFDQAADEVLEHVRAAEAAIGDRRGKEFDSTMTDLRILAQLARFHARRSLAAVHYDLYRHGGQRKAELFAAARGEREAVAAWRDLVAAAGDRYTFDLTMGPASLDLAGHWRDELAQLEANLQKLDQQSGPPDDPAAKEPAWTPRTTGDLTPPTVEHERVTSAVPPGQPLQITARATDPSGVRSLRLRYRHVTQYEDYQTLDMHPTARPDEYAATIPGEFLVPRWDAMYFIEAIDGAGNGTIWPDFRREPPYVFVKLQR